MTRTPAAQTAHARLDAHVAAATNETIALALRQLHNGRAWTDLGEVERLTSTVMIDELCRRFPALDAQLDTWAFDLHDMTPHDIVVTAFLTAHGL